MNVYQWIKDRAAELGIEADQPLEVNVGQLLGTEFFLLDPARKMGHRSKRDVFVLGRQ